MSIIYIYIYVIICICSPQQIQHNTKANSAAPCQAEEAMIDVDTANFVVGKLEELDEEELPVRTAQFEHTLKGLFPYRT